jgi:hypothetical protein
MLDLALQRNNDVQVGLIEESILTQPEMRIFPMRQIKSTAYKTLVRTGFPIAQFRHLNEGVARSKSTFENRLTECFILDTQIAADKALADVWEPGGAASYQMIEAQGVMEAVMRRIGKQVYYGNSAEAVAAGHGDQKGFPGFLDAYDAANYEVDATGTTGCTSVWGVRIGLKDVHFVSGGDTLPNVLPEWRIQTVNLDDNTAFTAYVNSLMGWIGMQVGARYSLVRIANLSEQADKGLTDELGEQAIEKLPSGIVPDYFLCNRRSRRQLRNSRQAVAATGGFQPNSVPMPTDLAGIPLIVTDSIINGEETFA